MLISMNPKRIDDIIAGYAEAKNKYILYINNNKWQQLPTDKKATVKEYYKDLIPDDTGEFTEIFDSPETFYEFNTEVKATDTAFDWFPHGTTLTDKDYYIEVYVVAPNGTVPYNNVGITPKE